MAKCILSEDLRNAGIIGISGIVSREKPTKYNPNPVRVLMSVRNGVQHISIGRKPVRSTKPDEAELRRRELFAICSKVRAQLTHNFGFLGSDPASRKLIYAAAKKAYQTVAHDGAVIIAPDVERELWNAAGLYKQMSNNDLFTALRNYVDA